ncbi:sigma-54-dependent transcriptional regulator [Thermodesulfobacteriota bacterium]
MSSKKKGKYPLHPILVVDDEVHALKSFELALRSGGFNNIIIRSDSTTVFSLLKKQEIELILLDISMPRLTGEEILSRMAQDFPTIPVIMVTGINEVATAVNCMRQGAFDYILKPIGKDRLLPSIKRAIEMMQLRRENINLTNRFFDYSLDHPTSFSKIITRNHKMQKIFQYCEAVAVGDYPMLITGETGVGKELLADAIHDLSGRDGTLVAVNIAGLDDNVFSDTLFGHTKGAFTGAEHVRKGLIEKASAGTLFLDEIGDLRPESQVKLLRLLDKKEYFPLGSDMAKPAYVRFLFATNKDPKVLKKSDSFRDDLFYRIHTHHIHIPPLRERLEDIPLLFDYFLDMACQEFKKKRPTYDKGLIPLLQSYHFPGNFRELQAMIFDAVGRVRSDTMSLESFMGSIQGYQDLDSSDSHTFAPLGDSWAEKLIHLPTLKEASRTLIQEALKRANHNQRIAAMMLGITPQALNQRLKKSP